MGREEWERNWQRGVIWSPAVKGSSGCHGKEKALQEQAAAGCRHLGWRMAHEMWSEKRGLRVGARPAARGAPTTGPALSPQVTLIPTFDSAAMHEWYEETHALHQALGITVLGSNSTVYAGRGLPACKVEFCPRPGHPRRCHCPWDALKHRNKPGATQLWPQFLLPAGDAAALQTPLLPWVVPQCGEGQPLRNPQQLPGQMSSGPVSQETQAWGGSTFQASGAGCLHQPSPAPVPVGPPVYRQEGSCQTPAARANQGEI